MKDRIIDLMDSPKWRVRVAALKNLENNPSEDDFDILLSGLHDRSWAVRNEASRQLLSRGEEGIKTLVNSLESSGGHARLTAVQALGGLREPSVQKFIKPLLNDRYPDVRIAAAEALVKTGDDSALSYLLEWLKNEKWNIRMKAAESLGRLENNEAVGPLAEALENEHVDIPGNVPGSPLGLMQKQLLGWTRTTHARTEIIRAIGRIVQNNPPPASIDNYNNLKKAHRVLKKNATLLGRMQNVRFGKAALETLKIVESAVSGIEKKLGKKGIRPITETYTRSPGIRPGS
ncbi:MAG: HEAT repeat domain-containing protein [Chloroflexi bacterium]|nr:HEAT repeat domain-containing protein [Chloroflexota bacterium]